MVGSRVPYRVGLVGFGGRGRGLARFWQGLPGAELVAVADLLPELLDQAHEAYPGLACYADHQAMLAEARLDVLTIATTGQYHARITHDACAVGIRGIYCEKPMACSLADADAMIADCQASGTVLLIGHERRWMEPIVQLRAAIRDGAIGRPTHGYVYWPTGRIGSNGTHFFDAINFMLDSAPVEVVGRVQRGLDLTKVEDHPVYRTRLVDDPGAQGWVTYANGVRLAIDCLNDVLLPYTYLFCGSRGRLDLEEVSWRIDYRARDADTRSHRDAWLPPVRRDFPAPGEYVDGVAERASYRELLACIETGARPTSAGEDGRLALETIVAFHLSAEAGMRPITLPLPAAARGYQLTIH
ncbi:MAG: Gfo/Idh/MocA family protein [Thermomicrobiales bacterium]